MPSATLPLTLSTWRSRQGPDLAAVGADPGEEKAWLDTAGHSLHRTPSRWALWSWLSGLMILPSRERIDHDQDPEGAADDLVW